MTMMKSWAGSNTGYADDTAFDSRRALVEGGEGDGLDTEQDDVQLGALPDIRPARLLLAEEDDELRRSIAGQLRNRGYEVDEAFSGYEAIALIARQSRSYDLIITDLQLYGMNGLELIDELRASARSEDSQVPVIVLGDGPSGAEAREAERLHAVMMEKPCDLERLWHQAESLARPVQIDSRPN
jgi:two-component system OmpR family response regulator